MNIKFLLHPSFVVLIPIISGISCFIFEFSPWVYMISILISYLLLIFSIHSHLVVSKKEFKNQDVWMILTYALATFFFIVAFAAGWKFFFDFKIGDEIYSPSRSTAVDALYFSFVVFSTLGFGDVLPGNGMAKIFIMLQLFVSSIHNVSFLTLLMLKRKG